jgi:hypothetical protein
MGIKPQIKEGRVRKSYEKNKKQKIVDIAPYQHKEQLNHQPDCIQLPLYA